MLMYGVLFSAILAPSIVTALPHSTAQQSPRTSPPPLPHANTSQPNFLLWTPPGPNDLRSPCPALNSLANHHLLPHSGRNITLPTLIAAFAAALNFGPDFTALIGSATLQAAADPLSGAFDLADARAHNHNIEHDASLSRADLHASPAADNYSFDPTVWAETLRWLRRGARAARGVVTIEGAATARWARVRSERRRDPAFTYGLAQWVFSYGETALYLSGLGDAVEGRVPLEWVRVFFEQERLPYLEGWRPPAKQSNLATLAAMIARLNAATGETVPDGLVLGESMFEMALRGVDPLTGNKAATYAEDLLRALEKERERLESPGS